MGRYAEQLVEHLAEELVRSGLSRAEAEAQVRRDLAEGRILYDPPGCIGEEGPKLPLIPRQGSR